MHTRQKLGGGFLLAFKDRDLVNVALGLQAGITPPPVRMNHASEGN